MAKLRSSSKKEETKEEVVVKSVEETAPVNEEKVEEIKPLEVKPLVEVETVEEKKSTQPNVRIKLKADLRTYIGDQWYNFKAGQITTVPKQVKDILAKAGILDIL